MEGPLFTSFEEAWAAFLAREEPLEDFFGQFPEEEASIDVWHAPPGWTAAAEAAAVQRELAGLAGLSMTPAHWLHVSLDVGEVNGLETVRARLRGFGAFEAEFGPATCFHDALVLEVRSERFAELVRAVDPERELSTFLPHLSIAYVDGAPEPGPIRTRLVELRERPRARDVVSEVQLCVVPIARDELLSPWRRVGTVPLG